ncbi:hypothetical protein [Halorubrum depositum]|uniref:hypothetical protein n=1 Tax=Halorubrum depositum TaxID=2583992 RepID=UPI0011AA7DF5|nr:hypothetical protein [Halorubrum depositum]
MPSTSGSSETSGGIDVETADPEDGRQRRPSATAGVRPDSDPRSDYHHRVRIAALAAEREVLDERVTALTDEMEALEAEVEALERAVESEERQRQQVIDSYETIVRERSEADRESGAEAPAEREATDRGPLAAVASRIGRAVARLRRSDD